MLDKIKQIIEDAYNQHPYKIAGNLETYSEYNEGWSDAVDYILSEIGRRVTND